MRHFSQLVSVCLHLLFIRVRKRRDEGTSEGVLVGKVDAAVTTSGGRVGSPDLDISPCHQPFIKEPFLIKPGSDGGSERADRAKTRGLLFF